MNLDHQHTTLGQCAIINDRTFSPKEAWPFVNYLDTGNITDNHITKFHSIHTLDELPSRARRKVRQGDIVYSTVRPNMRHFGILQELPDNVLVSTGFAVIRGILKLSHTNYIYWFLTQDETIDHLQTLAEHNTSAYPSIRPSDLENLEIILPPFDEQKAVANVLDTLDYKIRLNQQMNETLEEMARALFKSWFVDFDPVRAKMDGRWQAGQSLPGLPAELYDLFPDRLVPSELGEIPEGWEIKPLAYITRNLKDKENPLESPDVLFNHYSIPAYDKTSSPKLEPGSDIKSTKNIVPPGVVLISRLNPDIDRVWLVDVKPEERAVCSTEFLVLNPEPPFSRYYIYCLACSTKFRQQIQSLVTGTSRSHQRARVPDVMSLDIIVPNGSILHYFKRISSSLLARPLINKKEISAVAELRDILLPKLLSGEIRVSDWKEYQNDTPAGV